MGAYFVDKKDKKKTRLILLEDSLGSLSRVVKQIYKQYNEALQRGPTKDEVQELFKWVVVQLTKSEISSVLENLKNNKNILDN